MAQTPATAQQVSLRTKLQLLSPRQMDEVLWLARCIYSESDQGHEQRLVAWVVRNRVETQFRGTSYREVVLEPRQFSAFNDPTRRRAHILSLDQNSINRPWRQALDIALDVYGAPASKRPFPNTTRHFYSPISMEGGATPHWAKNETPLSSRALGVDPYRFKFFDGIDEGLNDDVQVANEIAPPTPTPTRMSASKRSRRSKTRFSGKVRRPRPPRHGRN